VTPGCSSSVAGSANDLKPLSVRALRNIGSTVRERPAGLAHVPWLCPGSTGAQTWQLGHQ
jgi:hypothetical protein